MSYFSLDTLFKNLNKDNFKYLRQEVDSNVLDVVKQNEFYPYEYMSDFEKFEENSQTDNVFIVH